MNPANAWVLGLDNGGVEISCLLCNETLASGGCTCCDDNEVTLIQLIQVTRDHFCKELVPA